MRGVKGSRGVHKGLEATKRARLVARGKASYLPVTTTIEQAWVKAGLP